MSVMGHDPDSMRTTCQEWMGSDADNLPDDIDAATWCDHLVDWMEQHRGAGTTRRWAVPRSAIEVPSRIQPIDGLDLVE